MKKWREYFKSNLMQWASQKTNAIFQNKGSISIIRFYTVLMLIVVVFALLVVFQEPPIEPAKIGVVDMKRVYQEAFVYYDIRVQQQEQEEKWRQEAWTERQILEKKDIQLSKLKRKLKKAVFDKKANELKNQILDFQNRQMAQLNLISMASKEILEKVEKQGSVVAQKVAFKKGLDLVLIQEGVLYVHKNIDITDDFVVELNRTMQRADFKNLSTFLTTEEE